MSVDLPARGFVLWPVGCGDSTMIKVNDNVVMQVDIHHMAHSEDDDDPCHPVIDTLAEEVLPVIDGEPYLAVFALSHPDQDHCRGFKELNERIRIGELWFSPRVLRDYEANEDLCEDAQAFCAEVNRRIEANCEGEAGSGDRIRIIGNDDILDEEPYCDLPDDRKSRPGETVTVLDGVDLEGTFRAFLHAPFGDDSTGERNKTSLAMQITLTEGDASGRLMLLGDLDYPPLKRIFVDFSDDEDKAWDVLLAPHHCSKSAMYFQEEGDSDAVLKQDVLDAIANAAGETGWVVASSIAVPTSNDDGDNPPHAKAKARYEETAPSGFLCTSDDEESDDPISFEVNTDGISLYSDQTPSGTSAARAAVAARVVRAGDRTVPKGDRRFA